MSASQPCVVGLGGTTDPSSSSERVLVSALSSAREQGAETRPLTARELELPMYAPGRGERSEAARDFTAQIASADGVIISTPAYHGSVSGLLKNAIDYLENLREAERPYLDRRLDDAVARLSAGKIGIAVNSGWHDERDSGKPYVRKPFRRR